MEERLSRIRPEFVKRVPVSLLKDLLDDLLQQKVLSTDDKDTVLDNESIKTDKARCLIDMVIRKGERASQKMVDSLKAREPELCIQLGLTEKVSPTAKQQHWSSELLLSPEVFKTEKLKDTNNIYPILALATRTRLALVITNVTFDHLDVRSGAEKDEHTMGKLLHSLGYNVVTHRNLSGAAMDKAVKIFSEDPRLARTDSVFVVIMSHGKMGGIFGVHHDKDAKPDVFPINNIYKHLDPKKCGGLRNKPKVIIIQACRGDTDGSVLVTDGPGSVPSEATGMQVDGSTQPQLADQDEDEDLEADTFHRLHKEKDLILLLSSTADTVSYRHSQHGSLFIQYIVEIFNSHAHEDHIEELFRKVMKRFEDKTPSVDKRQMPVKERCTLTKEFYLFPGH